jgi:hypothetical protein
MKKKPNLSSNFSQQVINAASKGCNAIEPGDVRRSRQLCGAAFWGNLSKPQQIEAGFILSTAIDEGRLPLVKLGRSSSNHKRYERE